MANASRTLLLDIRHAAWDDDLLRLCDVPAALLPDVRSCSEVYAETDPSIFGRPIPIAAAAGDQQSATFGQACFEPKVRDVVEAMDADLGTPLRNLRVDGGGAGDLVCGLIANQLGRSIERPAVRETTAFGVAALASLAVGFWADQAEIAAVRTVERRFEPRLHEPDRAAGRRLWQRAVERARGWAADD